MWRQMFHLSRQIANRPCICQMKTSIHSRTVRFLSDDIRTISSQRDEKHRDNHELDDRVPSDNHEFDDTVPSESLDLSDSFGTLSPKLVKKDKQISAKKTKLQKLSANQYKEIQAMKSLKSALSESDEKLEISSRTTDEWQETFGTLAKDEMQSLDLQLEAEKEDEAEPEHVPLRARGRHTPNWYGMQMEKLGKEGKIFEAIEMFEVSMMKVDRVHPTRYTFTTLIGILGRAGYTKKAFQLYNQMKKFGLEPQKPTYTALFNACANSPFPDDAIRRADKLRQQLTDKGVSLNLVIYRAMIKAYGKLGQLETAFQLVDELIKLKYSLDGSVFQHLLIACISDKEAGFTHAIQVWRQMRKRGIKPETSHYNLLLRAARDCALGDPDTAGNLLHKTSSKVNTDTPPAVLVASSQIYHESDMQSGDGAAHTRGLIEIQPVTVTDESAGDVCKHTDTAKSWWHQDLSHITSPLTVTSDNDVMRKHFNGISVQDMNIPNILNPRGLTPDTVAVLECPTSELRLALLGGAPGLLSHMSRDNCKPDIKTFSMLLEMIPSALEAEIDILTLLSKHKVKPDTDFFNGLIRKRNLRHNFQEAKEVLRLMSQVPVSPNIQTFGCLAMGCSKKQDGLQLLRDMQNAGLYPNVEIMGIMIHRAGQDWSYKMQLCKTMSRLQIEPNKLLLKHIETHRLAAYQAVIDQEKGKQTPPNMTGERFKENFSKFSKFYKPWLIGMKLEEEIHPWQQFQQPHPDTVAKQQEEEFLNSAKLVS